MENIFDSQNAPKDKKDGAAPAAYLPEMKTAILWQKNTQRPYEANKIEVAIYFIIGLEVVS